MATTNEYIEYVCEQIKGVGEIRYKKMVQKLINIKIKFNRGVMRNN